MTDTLLPSGPPVWIPALEAEGVGFVPSTDHIAIATQQGRLAGFATGDDRCAAARAELRNPPPPNLGSLHAVGYEVAAFAHGTPQPVLVDESHPAGRVAMGEHQRDKPRRHPPTRCEAATASGCGSAHRLLDLGAQPQQAPAALFSLAGTPTSRSAAALMPVRFAHEAATFTNASSSSGSRAALSILGEVRVDV